MLGFSIAVVMSDDFVIFGFECLEKVQIYRSNGFRGKGWDLG